MSKKFSLSVSKETFWEQYRAKWCRDVKGWSLHCQDLIRNSPDCLPYNCYYVSLDNLVLNQLKIPQLIPSLILITCLPDNVLIL